MRVETRSSKQKRPAIESLIDFTEPFEFESNTIVEEFEPIEGREEALEKKKKASRRNLEKKEEALDKIIQKTDRILKNHSERVARATAESSEIVVKPSPKRSQIKRRASYVEYLCLKGIKKGVLENIKKNTFKDEGIWKSIIDTEEIKEKINKTSNLIRDAIYRMKEEGWFEVIHSSQSGRRIVEINPKHYGIKEHDA